jgi:lysophospholipase L1-like esterase
MVLAGCKTTTTYDAVGGTTPSKGSTDDTDPSPRQRDLVDSISSVAMVGDSITAASTPALRDAFSELGIDDDKIVIDGETSRRIENGSGKNGHALGGVRVLTALLEDGADPSVWVIALGTNDVGLFGTPQECAELIEKITALLPPPVPLVWVNVYRETSLRQTRVFNEVLDGVIAARGDAVIADWYAVATDPDVDVLRSDHLHPNEEGQLAFANLVVQALQRL